MKEWQFDILFFVGVGGAVFLLFAPAFHLDGISNPVSITGVGTILTYVLTQKPRFVQKNDKDKGGDHKRDNKESP